MKLIRHPQCDGHNTRLCANKCKYCRYRSFAGSKHVKLWSDKNGDLTPRDVFPNARINCFFKCINEECGHVFEAKLCYLSSKLKPNWCPYCCRSSKKLCKDPDCKPCFEKSFASCTKSKQWSSENKKKPRDVFLNSHKKFKFNCNKCGHLFEAALHHVSANNPSWCPHCATSKKRCKDKFCKICLPNTLAFHYAAQYWSYEDNDGVEPWQVMLGSKNKYWFICECGSKFKMRISSITSSRKSWCPYCKNKTEKKLYDECLVNYGAVRQPKYTWCRNPETNKYLPFDFVIEDKKIIIELDGEQHFKQVANWSSFEETQLRDRYKEEQAIKNGYAVIRLLQTDVYRDKKDWKTLLKNAIEILSDPMLRVFDIILLYEEETMVKLYEFDSCIIRYGRQFSKN